MQQHFKFQKLADKNDRRNSGGTLRHKEKKEKEKKGKKEKKERKEKKEKKREDREEREKIEEREEREEREKREETSWSIMEHHEIGIENLIQIDNN